MTERWGYVVALPLCDYYNEEIWRRVFPPSEDDEEMAIKFDPTPLPFDFDPGEFRRMVERAAVKYAHSDVWITPSDRPCPDCEKVKRQPKIVRFRTEYKPRKPDEPT